MVEGIIFEKGGAMPKPPAPPAAPRLTDAATSASVGAQKKRRGFGSTLLTGGMGGESGLRSLLGG